MNARFARLLPDRIAAPMLRHATVLGALGVVLLLIAGLAVASLVSPTGLGFSAARISETSELPDSLRAGGLTERDADNDGLSDSLENYLFGTDPTSWNSSGLGIPDGWLAEFGFDPLSPLVQQARGVAPPMETLPLAYNDGYPAKFTPLLADYYAHGKPAAYVPGVDAPWWRAAAHADPTKWEAGDTGIPVGWLIHYGLPLTGFDPDAVASASIGNLTIRQAFDANTNPRALDSDLDGLTDWEEIKIHGTNPARYSTTGIGIADGWLVHFGLNPFDAAIAGQDTDLDGLTNLEEFFYSENLLRADITRDGIQVMYTQGLNPLDWQTGKKGIPDGWFVRYGLDAFNADVDASVGRASDWPQFRSYVPPDAPANERRAADLSMTVREAYAYGRPADWNETRDGVWWGGTNPATLDSDEDGIPDPVEILGWYANVTFGTGPEAKSRYYLATSNPLERDSDSDGLLDIEEYLGRSDCGDSSAPARSFPPTDPRNRDTAFSGLTDHEKVCGIVRDDVKYEFLKSARFDPTRADSAGDLMHDGARIAFWHARAAALRASPAYPYEGSVYLTVFDWTEKYARFAGMDPAEVIVQFRADGDVDGDGIPNALDADPSGGLAVERFGDPSQDALTKVFFLGGPQMDPTLYKHTEFTSTVLHSASDPANPDTDGDGLPDAWETRFGTFDPAIPGWNLDPAKCSSTSLTPTRCEGGSGVVTDGDANNDADKVTWYAYNRRGSGTERITNEFELTNRLEFTAGTDPNRFSTANDGISDAWKAFWGSRVSDSTFPTLISSRDPRAGDVALAKAEAIEQAFSTSPIQPLADLKGKGDARKSTGYVRSVNVSTCSAPVTSFETFLKGEEWLPAASPCKGNVMPLEGTETNFLLIEGVHRLTYRREVDLRTNPYLTDSDGDGAPDAYESYMLERQRERIGNAAQFPHPAVVDGDRDSDVDGVGLADECGRLFAGDRCSTFEIRHERADGSGMEVLGVGSDPNAADTDLDGIDDGIEIEAGLKPLDPSDVLNFRDPNRDTDGDRLPDYLELTGWGRNDFGINVRTDPQNADTDGDGLLDGESITLDLTSDATRIAAWTARGIAHTYRTVGGTTTVTFLGEKSYASAIGALPTRLFAPDTKIPEGWIGLYPTVTPTSIIASDAYGAFRPSWWEEERHGVWWWGRVPGAANPSIDLDADGLHDETGEDPMPGYNRLNRVTAGATVITDPRALSAYVEAGATAEAIRARAQSIGDEPGAPAHARALAQAAVNANGVSTRIDGARVLIQDLALAEGATTFDWGQRITKGVAFNVTGRVVLDERNLAGALMEGTEAERVGLANRTVYVSLFAPSRATLVGAGITNATGHFKFAANITSQQTFDITVPGVVMLGEVDGVATSLFDPSLVASGNTTGSARNRLVAWVSNTSATTTAGAPTHEAHQARLPDASGTVSTRTTYGSRFAASLPIEVTVFSETQFTTTIEPTAENGRKLIGDIVLRDASGGVIGDKRVLLTWTGTTPVRTLNNLSTDREGRVNVTNLGIPIAVRDVDQYAITVKFTSTDANLAGTTATFPVRVRSPTTLTAVVDEPATIVGSLIRVTGTLRTQSVTLPTGEIVPSTPVARVPVAIVLGGITQTATTDAKGDYEIRITVPSGLGSGPQLLTVQYAGSDVTTGSEGSAALSVKRKADIISLNKLSGPRAIDVTLTGRLVDNEGKAVIGTVRVDSPDARLAQGLTERDGGFSFRIPLRNIALGTQTLSVSFLGDGGHSPATNTTTARVTSATTLRIIESPTSVIRGESFGIRALLIDDGGVPLPAAGLDLTWRGAPAGGAVTGPDGVATFTIRTNASERAVATSVGATYAPAATAIYGGASAGATVRVLAGTSLVLDAQNVHRGPIHATGILLDDEGRPLPGAHVTVAIAGVGTADVVTARNGSFAVDRVIPLDFPLGPVAVSAKYRGTDALAGRETTTTWNVQSPVEVRFASLGPFVRGESSPISGQLIDDRGRPVNGTLHIAIGDLDIGDVSVKNGRFDTKLSIPASAPRGAARAVISMPGTDAYEPFTRVIDTVIKVRPNVDVKLPTIAVRGFSFSASVMLEDDQSQPLRNTTFVYFVGKDANGVTGRTDSEGRATLASVAPLTGDAVVALTVRAGPDVVSSTSTFSGARVVGPATPIGYAALFIGALIVVGIAAVIVAAVILRRRQLTEAREIIEDAIRELLAGNEYTGTIFLAYRRLVAHLGRHGFAEKASDTPREFAVGVRKALPVGAIPLRELIRLFEEARYSDHPIGSMERDSAVESLALVRSEIDRLLGKKEVAS